MKKNIIIILTTFISYSILFAQNNVVVADKSIVLNTATNQFHGIEYYDSSITNPYEDNDTVIPSLDKIDIDIVQIKVHLNEITPIELTDSGTYKLGYNFDDLDAHVNLINSKGYVAAIHIMPDRYWFPFQKHYIDNKYVNNEKITNENHFVYRADENGELDYGWWNYNYMNGLNTMQTWRLAIHAIASRYKNKNIRLVIFDEPAVYESVKNEEGNETTNVTVGDKEFALTLEKAAEVYINAAEVIKGWENLNHIKIGGFAGHKIQASRIAKEIFIQDGNYDNLDFLAMNIFLGVGDDYSVSDGKGYIYDNKRFQLLNRTIQFEELPKVTQDFTGFNKELMIDSYNVFGAFNTTFPSNTNHFGGIFQTLAQLHAFKGGVDVMLKWNVIGASGIFSGGFNNNDSTFTKNPTYYAWDFTHNVIELKDGNSIIECKTQEEPLNVEEQHFFPTSNPYSFLTNDKIDGTVHFIDAFSIQPFAILKQDGGINMVLINKTGEGISRFVKIPDNMSHYEIYKFTEDNVVSYQDMITIPHTNSTNIDGEYSVNLYCNPESISVIKFYPNLSSKVTNEKVLNDINVTVSNSTLNIESNASSNYKITFYNIHGVNLRTEELKTNLSKIDINFLNPDIYILKIKDDKNKVITKKILIN